MTTGVSRPQVVLATDLATAVRLAKDRDLLKLSPSTLFPDLRPAKLACTAARETTFLLPDRTGTPVVVTLEVAAQAAISYQEKKKPSKTQNREIIFTSSAASHTEGAVLEKVTSNGEQLSDRKCQGGEAIFRTLEGDENGGGAKRARRDRWINPGSPFIYSVETPFYYCGLTLSPTANETIWSMMPPY